MVNILILGNGARENAIYNILSIQYENIIYIRDIKTNNIVLHNNTFKYIDFGFSSKLNDSQFKNRSLSKIRIDFTLAENDLAKIEVLDIYVRVEKPSGDVFFDIYKGSGSFTFENRELFYTIKEELLVDRFEKKLSLEYEKNEDFNRGIHKVVLYTKKVIY